MSCVPYTALAPANIGFQKGGAKPLQATRSKTWSKRGGGEEARSGGGRKEKKPPSAQRARAGSGTHACSETRGKGTGGSGRHTRTPCSALPPGTKRGSAAGRQERHSVHPAAALPPPTAPSGRASPLPLSARVAAAWRPPTRVGLSAPAALPGQGEVRPSGAAAVQVPGSAGVRPQNPRGRPWGRPLSRRRDPKSTFSHKQGRRMREVDVGIPARSPLPTSLYLLFFSPLPPGLCRASAHPLLPLAGVVGFITVIYDCFHWNGKENQNMRAAGGHMLCTGNRPGRGRPLSLPLPCRALPRCTAPPRATLIQAAPPPPRPALLPFAPDPPAPL